jgi:putative acetyltransferase
MTAAQKLYKKNGFKKINTPMGNTCHYSCDVWMIRKL